MEKISGFFWHVHHNIFLEWCHDYNERADYIRSNKPVEEQELRLRLFQPIKGELPLKIVKSGRVFNEVWQALNEAEQTFNNAKRAYDKARQAYDGSSWQAREEKWQARDEKWRARDKAGRARDKARQAINDAMRAHNKALKKHMPKIVSLHNKECQNCPWDGQTIF